jgi:hypothetical protein
MRKGYKKSPGKKHGLFFNKIIGYRSAYFGDLKGIVTGSYCGGIGLTKTSFYHMLYLIIF